MRLPLQNVYREPPEDVTPIPMAIVGRPNVGKSTLFNRLLSGTRKSRTTVARAALVSSRPGTTRDRKDAVAVFGGLFLRLIDTGGLETEDATRRNALLAAMREQVFRAIAESAAILFVIDAREGITGLDLEIAVLLRDATSSLAARPGLPAAAGRPPPPVILVANKAEGSFLGPYLNDCYELGLGDPVIISAKQSEGMDELYDRLCVEIGHLPGGAEEEAQGAEDDEDHEDHEEEGEDHEDLEDHAEAPGGEDEGEAGGVEQQEQREERVPVPTLPWMPPKPLTEEQKRSLRWYASHPADPLGSLDAGLKASVLHKEASGTPNYWLGVRQRQLPSKEVRDFVMQFRRLEDWEKPLRLSVVGLPNSGKSSIVNALLREERCVVDETEGTTMDAIVSSWSFKDHPVRLIDTCGVYRGWQYPGTYSDFLEPGMGTRKAIRRSHVVVLCIDAQRYRSMTYWSCPSQFEINLGRYVVDEGKALVIAINKWDLVEEEEQPKHREAILNKVAAGFHQVRGVPVVFLSARYSLNLSTLMVRAFALFKRWSSRLPTSKLNSWLQAWMLRWPPPWHHGQKMSVKYMTQTRARPPTFVLWINTTAGEMPSSYLRQLQNAMRDEFRISGVPLRFILRSTLMPKPRTRLSRRDVLRWRRVGPKQARAVAALTRKRTVRPARQTG